MKYILIIFSLLLISCASYKSNESYLWLEEVEGKKALDWVNSENAITFSKLKSDPRYKNLEEDIYKTLTDKEKIPYGKLQGKYVYNFWRGQKIIRGQLRRQLLTDYLKQKKEWEIVLDFDKLAKKENENWVYKGRECLLPEYRYCLIRLSRGGKDASVYREFDLEKKVFIKNGFKIKEGKSSFEWINKDTLLIGTDFGKGSLTKAGYPRITKIWKRGTNINKAKTIFTGNFDDTGVWPSYYDKTPEYLFVLRTPERYKRDIYVYDSKTLKRLIKLPVPIDSSWIGMLNYKYFIKLRSDLNYKKQVYKKGSVLVLDIKEMIRTKNMGKITVLFKPNNSQSLRSLYFVKNKLIISYLEDVNTKYHEYSFSDNQWVSKELKLPITKGKISLFSTDEDRNDYFFYHESFLNPQTLYYFDGFKSHKIKSLKSKFNSKGLKTKQYFAISKDGTKVPYFIVSKNIKNKNKETPTLIYAYGGFEVSRLPGYSPILGQSWLSKGGQYVLANIRGGGEYGPSWHQAALKEKRHKAFEDFYAVANDLIKRGLTSPVKLAIKGGSNGGLLTAVALTQRPNLYKAIISAVPLADMERFHKLLAGHSWVGEYGNPDIKKEKEFLLNYSPFHNIKASPAYPQAFFTTSTMDDRVHPAHARKMVAKLKDYGQKVLYYENTEGGHAGAANYKQTAQKLALEYIYLYQELSF
jgi:prolyl oligopeptidase